MTTMITRAVPTHGRRQRCVQRGRSRRTSVRVTLGAVVAAALAALVGGAGSPAWAGTPTVQVETNATFGAILASSSAMALYTLNTDHNGQSTCHGSCATAWPALTVPAGTVAIGGPGVTGTVGTATQSNGTTQVTYNGSPLYTFVGDVVPGQVTGNNVSGFFVVTAGLTTSTTTPGTTPAPTGTAPPAPGASSSATPALPQATTPGASGASTSPSGAAIPSASSAAAGALAFTGVGAGLRWLLLLALLLLAMGAVITFVAIGRIGRDAHVGAQ